MSEVNKPKGNKLMPILSGVLGLGLIVAAVLYSTQVSKTDEANGKISNLTLDLGTANGKINSLTSELTASKDRVTTLTADLGTTNGKVTSLSADLGTANTKVASLTSDLGSASARVTSLTTDLATANGRVTSLTASLSAANANITKLSADLAVANANVTKLSADLATVNANVTRLSSDLAAANANVAKLTSDLAAANAQVTKLNADLATAKQDAADYAALVLVLAYPRHFNSVQELNSWLATDNTNSNTAYAGLTSSQRCYILQVNALQDGFLLPAAISVSSNGTVYYNNVAIVGGSVYAVNVLTDQIFLEGTTSTFPLYPVPLSLH